MYKHLLIVLALVVVVIGVVVIAYCIYALPERLIGFELYDSFEMDTTEMGWWYAITENGFYTKDMFARDIGDEYIEHSDLDINNYSYVVCFGYSLTKLTYTYGGSAGMSGGNVYYYIKAYVKPEDNYRTVNIYKLDKKNVDMDIHTNYGTTVVVN